MSKDLKDRCIGMNINQKERTKIQLASIDILLNQNSSVKRFNDTKYYLPEVTIKNYKVIVNRKNFYRQPIYSDIKRYKEIRKLTIG